MKFSSGLLVLASLALSVISTPLQQATQSDILARSNELDTRAHSFLLNRGEEVGSEVAVAQSIQAHIGSVAAIAADSEALKATLANINGQTSLGQIFALKDQLNAFVTNTYKVTKVALKSSAVSNVAEAAAVYDAAEPLLSNLPTMLEAFTANTTTLWTGCGLIWIIQFILCELFFIILTLIWILTILLGCDPTLVVKLGAHEAAIKASFKSAIAVLSK